MRRRAFNILALLGLAFCIAITSLWVRSYWVLDSVFFESLDHGYLISSSNGYVRAIRRDAVYASGGVQFARYPPITFNEPDHPAARSFMGASTGLNTFNGAAARWIVVPLWMFSAAGGVVPIAWLVHRRRIARRARAGFCRHCGYDLRATPEKCPECGALAAARPAA